MKQKVTAIVVCCLVLVGALPFASAATTTYSDVPKKAWYHDFVYEATALGLFEGMDSTHFEPEGNMTRAQFVTVLSRIAGANVKAYSVTKFKDVTKKAWYFHEVSWAARAGIVDGMSAVTFEPDTPVTREQLCTMIARFSTYQKISLPAGSVSRYKDAGQIASWAKAAIGQCSAAGLVEGDNGLFSPKNNATRAQGAKILSLYYKDYIAVQPEKPQPPAGPDVLGITASGFTVSGFDQNTDYYLCYPASFSGLRITAVKTRLSNPTVSISVEQYCGKVTEARLGDVLDLGYGRARVTVTVKTGGKTYAYQINLTDPNQGGYYYAFLIGETPMRSAPSDTASVLTTLQSPEGKGVLYCVGTDEKWTHVQRVNGANAGQEGWVLTERLTRGYSETDMPASYKEQINALETAHPNWTFTFADVGVSLTEYAQTVSSGTYGSPSVEAVKAAMDPTAYFYEQYIFAFLDASRYDAAQSAAGLAAMWDEKENAVVTEAQAIESITEAGRALSLNPYFIAARAILESGHGTSALAKGTVSGYEGFYNFYGIGATDANAAVGGASYAKNRGWNTPYRAIVEGANWIKDQYVDRGQSTSYFIRFFPYRAHAYMSDLGAPKKDAELLYQGYSSSSELMNSALHFIIPVYGAQ